MTVVVVVVAAVVVAGNNNWIVVAVAVVVVVVVVAVVVVVKTVTWDEMRMNWETESGNIHLVKKLVLMVKVPKVDCKSPLMKQTQQFYWMVAMCYHRRPFAPTELNCWMVQVGHLKQVQMVKQPMLRLH